MSTETSTPVFGTPVRSAVVGGVAGGLLGGVGMGVVLHAGANMMALVGALYGRPTVVTGWIAHLGHSVLIGLLFAAIASRAVLARQTTSVGGCACVGIAYAAAVGLVTGGFVLPLSLQVVGARTLPEPLLPLPGLLGGVLVVVSVGVAHLVYGLLLGATFGYLHDAGTTSREDGRVAGES